MQISFNDCDRCEINDESSFEIMRTPALSSIAQPVLSLSSLSSNSNIEISDSSCSISSEVSLLQGEERILRIACANTRSIVEKISSLVVLFEEAGLCFALLTETWLTARLCPPRTMNDLTLGANLSFVR